MENLQISEHLRPTGSEIHLSSLLIDEIENENINEVKWLLKQRSANPNIVLPNLGVSPMHVLAGLDNECFSADVLEIALEERGGDPNIRSADGLTPVHVAAIWGRCSVLEILLKFGGDPFLLDYKFLLSAEDLALKEHQWQTHAILATFAVYNDKQGEDQLDDYFHSSLSMLSSSVNVKSDKIALPYENAPDKEYLWNDVNSIDKDIKSLDINSNMSLVEAECQKRDMYQSPRSNFISSHEDRLDFDGTNTFDAGGVKTKDQDKAQRKKKLSDQFAKSFTMFKNLFRRDSFPKFSTSNSPKVYHKESTSKTSI